MGRRVRIALWAVAGVVALAVAASALFGGGGSDEASDSGTFESVGSAISTAGAGGGAGAAAADEGTERDATADAAAPSGEGSASLVAQGPLAGSDRKIISTGEMTVEVADVADAVGRAVDAAAPTGAVLTGQDSALEDAPRATLTFKVVPESFADLQDRFAGLGTLVTQRITTDDVTEQVVDLEARIATSRASVERIRALIGDATNVMDIASLEGELLRRETELESLEGQLRTLRDRVDLATVVLTLTEAAPGELEEPSPLPAFALGRSTPGFGDGLSAGWDAFVGIGTALLVVLGALLPFVPLVLLAALAWRLARHRRSAPPATAAVPAPSVHP